MDPLARLAKKRREKQILSEPKEPRPPKILRRAHVHDRVDFQALLKDWRLVIGILSVMLTLVFMLWPSNGSNEKSLDALVLRDKVDVLQPHEASMMFSEYKLKRKSCLHQLLLDGYVLADLPHFDEAQAGKQPFFCVNLPLRNFTRPSARTLDRPWQHHLQTAPGHESNVALMMDAGRVAWRRMIEGGHAGRTLALSDTRIYTPEGAKELGYYDTHFIARGYVRGSSWGVNDEALEKRSVIETIPYDALRAFYRDLREVGGDHCVCGVHLGITRNIVMFISDKQAQLFLEPHITEYGTPDRNYMDMGHYIEGLWTKKSLPPVVIKHREANRALLDTLGNEMTTLTSTLTVTAKSFDLEFARVPDSVDEKQLRLARRIRYDTYTGGVATCLQYCQQLNSDFARQIPR